MALNRFCSVLSGDHGHFAQRLYEQFQPSGFEILAFPCDQFGHQEPGSDVEIAIFCDATYGVTFPLFAKIEVNGKNAHPLYVWLKQQKGGLLGSRIKWNFTKFLVDRVGTVRARFAPMTKPERLVREVAELLWNDKLEKKIASALTP